MVLIGLTPWRSCCAVVHATWRNSYTGPSVHGFQIWSDDVMLCAKPKGLAVARNQSCVTTDSTWINSEVTPWKHDNWPFSKQGNCAHNSYAIAFCWAGFIFILNRDGFSIHMMLLICNQDNFEKRPMSLVVVPQIVKFKWHSTIVIIGHYAASISVHYHTFNKAAIFFDCMMEELPTASFWHHDISNLWCHLGLNSHVWHIYFNILFGEFFVVVVVESIGLFAYYFFP